MNYVGSYKEDIPAHQILFANNPDSPDEVAFCKEGGPYQHKPASCQEDVDRFCKKI